MTDHDDAHRGLGVAIILATIMCAVYVAIGVWVIH